MAKLNISQAAKLYGKDWKTIKRHITKGTLSQENDGLIDMAELVRVYGETKVNTSPTPENDNRAVPESASPEIKELFRQQIKLLERQVDGLLEERNKLLGIVERQTLLIEDTRVKEESSLKSDRWLVYTLALAVMAVTICTGIAIYYLKAGA